MTLPAPKKRRRTSEPKVTVSARVPQHLATWLQECAALAGTTPSAMIENLLTLKRQEFEKKGTDQ